MLTRAQISESLPFPYTTAKIVQKSNQSTTQKIQKVSKKTVKITSKTSGSLVKDLNVYGRTDLLLGS